jgi:type IV secretory pathway VirB3-like protein
MHLSPIAALLAWIPAGIYLLRRFPVRVAILANFFGGWALLPGANYTPSTSPFPYWILGVALPANYFLTKASVTGIAAIAGVSLFHFAELRRFRPHLCDLPMALWCIVPLLSALAHPDTFRGAFFGAAYLTLAWGVPWTVGRIFFSAFDSLLLAAKATVISGLCYIPICLVEIYCGPRIYAFLYGYQPYRWVGAQRYLGFRPIGFLEDGNQLGIWMAVATLIAVSLSVRGLAPRILGLPVKWAASLLAVVTLLCQSVGSILLLLFLLPMALLKRRFVMRTLVTLLIMAIMLFALFQISNRISLRAFVKENHAAHSFAAALTGIGRHSLAWRIAREESDMALAMRSPWLGSGKWNWWQDGDSRPWSLWLLVLGMYGLVGLLAFGSILFLPILRSVWSPADERHPHEASLRQLLAAAILVIAFDNLLNGAMILPYLVLMGGLATKPSSRESAPISGAIQRPL